MQETDAARRFTSLYETHFDAVYGYLVNTAGRQLAEELAGETFLVAWRRLDDIPLAERAWLFGVARNLLLESRRSAARARSLDTELRGWITVAEPHTADIADGVAYRALALSALTHLSEADREVLGDVRPATLEPPAELRRRVGRLLTAVAHQLPLGPVAAASAALATVAARHVLLTAADNATATGAHSGRYWHTRIRQMCVDQVLDDVIVREWPELREIDPERHGATSATSAAVHMFVVHWRHRASGRSTGCSAALSDVRSGSGGSQQVRWSLPNRRLVFRPIRSRRILRKPPGSSTRLGTIRIGACLFGSRWSPGIGVASCARFGGAMWTWSVVSFTLPKASATELILAGVDIRTVAGRLGHAGGGSTTLRTYTAWVSEADQRAAGEISARMPSRPVVPAADLVEIEPTSPYELIAVEIRDKIADGSLPVGLPIPSVMALAHEHAVSVSTVQRAITLLKSCGLVTVATGRRTLVRQVPVPTGEDEEAPIVPMENPEPSPKPATPASRSRSPSDSPYERCPG